MEYLSFHSCNLVSSNCDYRIYRIGQLNLLYFLTLAAILLGCLLNCFPCLLALRFSLVVAAYSAGDKALIAALGKYLSPVTLDFFPDLVRHFCLDHAFKLLCLLVRAMSFLHSKFSYTHSSFVWFISTFHKFVNRTFFHPVKTFRRFNSFTCHNH